MMAPISSTNIVELKLRDSFSHDPVFADCWDTLEKQRDRFRRDCDEVEDRILGNTQLKSISLLAPSTLPEYVKLQQGGSQHENGTSSWTQHHEQISYNFNPNGNNIYKIIVDVHQFNPYARELSVKTSTHEKNVLMIEAVHREKKEGHGTIARQFIRKCVLPFDIKLAEVEAHLSTDGVLLINVPLKINGVTNGKRELMTVDGRKLEESEVDLSRLDSKKVLNGNGTGVVHREQLKNWDAKIQTLPDFGMVPFWYRKYSPHHQELNGLGIQKDPENFTVLVDLKAFLPEEVSVRCTEQFVIVEGNQELKQDPFGFLSRQFTRMYELPTGVKAEGMACNLSSGILQIKAPKPKPRRADHDGYGTRIPITMSEPGQGFWQQARNASAPGPMQAQANQRMYVPPKRGAPAKVAAQVHANANGNGRAASDGDGEDDERGRQSPMHVNGDAHSERTIIPFVAAAGNSKH